MKINEETQNTPVDVDHELPQGDASGDSVSTQPTELDKLKSEGQPVPPELQQRIEKTRSDYEKWLDARHAAARGHVDALIDPLETRRILTFALEAALARNPRQHLVLETL